MMNIRTVNHKTPFFGPGSFIDPFACVSGDVITGNNVSIWPFVSIRGDLEPIRIGDRTNIQEGAILHTSHQSKFFDAAPLTIGDDVTIGHGAICHGCKIGNRVLIGMHATILDNVIIEDNVIIGAGALVPPRKKLDSGYLYIGSPVKQARALTEKELEFLQYSADNYVKLSKKHQDT